MLILTINSINIEEYMYYCMVYTTVNMKPKYMKKLEKLCGISRRSKTVEIECMIDKELQNLKESS